MPTRRLVLGTMGGVAIAALMATGTIAQEVTLRLHQFLPAQANVPKQILDVWADNIERDSDGRIKVERYASMALGGRPPELMDQAIYGVADVIWTVVGYTPGRFPSTEVFELPFMVTDARAASSAFCAFPARLLGRRQHASILQLLFCRHLVAVGFGDLPVAIHTPLEVLVVRIRLFA